ncbi:hypothetical protein [Isoptericola sp. NPDC057559]|uniref:hypothetical protein n=1 Tax=Isoptericola sp. NPDC057559 TaxID=3346168 RepID=UPI0036B3E50C
MSTPSWAMLNNVWMPFAKQVFEVRARRFEALDVTSLSPDELYAELMWVVATSSARPGDPYHVSLPMLTLRPPAGTILWRARALAPDDHTLPLRGMHHVADAWEPPAQFIRAAGRLNKPNESLLYTCIGSPMAAPREIRAEDGARFSLMKFEATEDLSLTGVGLPAAPDATELHMDESSRLISEFFARQFLRPARDANGSEYYLSELVAKLNYDLPPAVHDGWTYPSTQTAGAINATFYPKAAHQKLALRGVAVCTFDSASDSLQAWCYSDADGGSAELTWHTQGSPVQLTAFPEFSTPSR